MCAQTASTKSDLVALSSSTSLPNNKRKHPEPHSSSSSFSSSSTSTSTSHQEQEEARPEKKRKFDFMEEADDCRYANCVLEASLKDDDVKVYGKILSDPYNVPTWLTTGCLERLVMKIIEKKNPEWIMQPFLSKLI